ncbi:MAG: TetR/AcrR family transcriptional regulator [Pseudomonadota bacterium]
MSKAEPVTAAPASGDPDAKEVAIIAAARTVFLAHGFDGASMDAIALAANVSKRTVYNRFRSKEALFGAAIEETCRRVLPVDVETVEQSESPLSYVEGLARAFLDAILDDEAIALRRIATFEAGRKPALGRSYLEHGLYFMVDNAERIVRSLQKRNIIRPDADPRLAVFQLGGLITEPLYTEVLLGERPADLDAAIEVQLGIGLDAFWRLYGVGETSAQGR